MGANLLLVRQTTVVSLSLSLLLFGLPAGAHRVYATLHAIRSGVYKTKQILRSQQQQQLQRAAGIHNGCWSLVTC